MPAISPFNIDDCRALLASHAHQIERGECDIRIEAAWADQLEASQLQLLTLHCPSSRWVLAAHAKNPDVLRRLASSGDRHVQEKVAENPSTPLDVLASLAANSWSDIRLRVARSRNVNGDILQVLAHDTYSEVRIAVVNNDRAPLDLLHLLARDTDSTVPIMLSRNKRLPLSFFETLIAAGNDHLRLLMAANSDRTDVLDLLARDSSAATRARVAENYAVTQETRKRLLKEVEVRRILAERRPNQYNRGCFVATACFGNASAPEVIVFRSFRDDVMQQSAMGRSAIELYYAISPSIAKWLTNHPSAAALVRKAFLQPLARAVASRAGHE